MLLEEMRKKLLIENSYGFISPITYLEGKWMISR